MRRKALIVLIATSLACSDNGPQPATVEGFWQLISAHGVALPTRLRDFSEPLVIEAVLRLNPPNSRWTRCVDEGVGYGVFHSEEVGFSDAGRLQLFYVERLGFIPDTMRLNRDSLLIDYTNGAGRESGVDQLVFVRTASDPLPNGCP